MRLLNMLLSGMIVIGNWWVPINFDSDNARSKNLNEVEILTASYYYLYSKSEDADLWNAKKREDVSVIPMYDTNGNINTYYVTTPRGYVILHNNIENPAAIEFGEGRNEEIEEILKKKSEYNIIYNGPYNIAEQEDIKTSEEDISLYDFYPELCEKNIKLSNTIKNTEKLMNKMNAIESTSSDWGFFNSSLLPIGNYVGRNLGSCTTTGWVQMSQFSDYNHCGPTAATNILKWFYKRGYSNVYRGSNLATYNGVKSYLVQFPMTGATASLRSGLTNYCSAWGYTLNSTQINTFSQLKTAINNNRICDMLLQKGLEFHWIVIIGYRDYTDDSYEYVRVMNGWSTNTSTYYMIGQGSTKVGSTAYWIS